MLSGESELESYRNNKERQANSAGKAAPDVSSSPPKDSPPRQRRHPRPLEKGTFDSSSLGYDGAHRYPSVPAERKGTTSTRAVSDVIRHASHVPKKKPQSIPESESESESEDSLSDSSKGKLQPGNCGKSTDQSASPRRSAEQGSKVIGARTEPEQGRPGKGPGKEPGHEYHVSHTITC